MFNYVEDVHLAEDIIQHVFLNIWKNREKMKPHLNIKFYLFKAAKNEALKHLRHNEVKKKSAELIYASNARQKTPEEKFNQKKKYNIVNKVINNLPNKGRKIFLLSKNDNLTYSEIAKIQNISVKTVETHIRRAYKFLYCKLKKYSFSLLIIVIYKYFFTIYKGILFFALGSD